MSGSVHFEVHEGTGMSDVTDVREITPEGLLGVTYVLGEILYGSLTGLSLPVALPGYASGLLVALTVAVGLLLLVRLGARWTSPRAVAEGELIVALVVLNLKLWIVSGGEDVLAGALFLSLCLLVVGLGRRFLPVRAPAGFLLVLSVLSSTDLVKSFWLAARDLKLFGLVVGSVLAAVSGAAALALLAGWAALRPRVRDHSGLTASLVLTGVLFTGGIVWGTWVPRHLEAGRVPTGSQFEGSVEPAMRVEEPGERLPNIFVVAVDTLRWDMVPPRVEGLTLPNLDSLRQDSLRFPRAHSTSSWTLPAFGSFFSGRLPVQHGAFTAHNRLYRSVPFYTHDLRTLGYETAGFTDGGFVGHTYGFARGYDVYWEQSERVWGPYRDFVPGVVELDLGIRAAFGGSFDLELAHRSSYRDEGQRRFRRNLRAFDQWYRRLDPPREPLFAFLHTFQLHDYYEETRTPPFYPENFRRLGREHPGLAEALRNPRDVSLYDPIRGKGETVRLRRPPRTGLPGFLVRRYERRVEALSSGSRARLRRYFRGLRPPDRRSVRRSLATMGSSAWKDLRDRLAAEEMKSVDRFMTKRQERRARRELYRYGLQDVDPAVGRLVADLEQKGLYEESVIVFVSDHGEGFELDHPVLKHDWKLHEVLTRVPLWIKLPGGDPAGRVDAPVQIHDVYHMLFRAMGVRPSGGQANPVGVSDWDTTPPVPVPRRAVVRSSVRSLTVDTPPQKVLGRWSGGTVPMRAKLSVRAAGHKAIQEQDEPGTTVRRVFEDHLFENPVPAASLSLSTRRVLGEHLRAYRALYRRFPDPFRRQSPRLDSEVREQLEGLGYL